MTTIDISGIGQKAFRGQIERLLTEQHPFIQIEADFWLRFPSEQKAASQGATLVLSDLSTIIRQFRHADVHHWRTAVRTMQPYFLALVRTQTDREQVEWIDEVLRASDLRLEVCTSATDMPTLLRCLTASLRSLEPDVITDARYSAADDRFWIQFGDGLSGTWTWDDLQLGFLAPRAIPQSVSPSLSGSSVELLLSDGGTYDIDAAVIRSLLDANLRERLSRAATDHRTAFGQRLRHVRTSLGLTQIQLSERSGLDQAVISRMEKGRVRPRIDTLNRLAESMGKSVADLLGA